MPSRKSRLPPDVEPPEPAFRRWLVTLVSRSRFSRVTGETDEELAPRLGLQPEILRLARERLVQDRAEKALPPRDIGGTRKYAPGELKEIFVYVPPPALDDLREVARSWSTTHATIVRSLVCKILENPRTVPAKIHKKWNYRGQNYKIGVGSGVIYLLTDRAHRDLTQIANERNTVVAALNRSVIIDFLEGRIDKLKLVSESADMPFADLKR